MGKLVQTRRDFVRTAALAGGATVAAATALNVSGNGYGSVAYADEPSWDMAADFVVVGAGTGQAAAVAAVVDGMSCILLEARPNVGGAMQHSGGAVWLPNTDHSQEFGDSYELAHAYLEHMSMGYDNLEIMEAFLDNTQKTLDTLDAAGVVLNGLPRGLEYHPTWEGALNAGGRTNVEQAVEPFQFARGGNFLNDALIAAENNLGVEVFCNTTGKRLVTKRETSDSVPEVIGIVAEDKDGNEIKIKANRGVLLATGGFEHDAELVKNYVRVPYHYFATYSTDNGGGLRMAQSVGADLRMMSQMWGNPVYTKLGEYYKEIDAPVPLSFDIERKYKNSIIVDSNGCRFCNELSDYDSIGHAFGGYKNWGENGLSCESCWYIFDQTCMDEKCPNGRGGERPGFPCGGVPEEELYIEAGTLEELAEKIGVPVETFLITVEQFNTYAREGRDPIFHRDEPGSQMVSPEAGDSLGPIETPPFRAIEVSGGGLGTQGGPRLNANAQVVHVSGEPIKGLYAAGNCAGVGAPGPSYGGAGGTLGPAFVMGIIAAEHASKRDDVTDNGFFVMERPERVLDVELGENEYAGAALGLDGDVVVKAKIVDGKIEAIEVVEQHETPGVGDVACAVLPDMVIEAQSADVDAIQGATVTSRAFLAAVKDCLSQAGIA